MKVVIFAGGIGSRISEESYLKPKPMIEIGGKPILWHIMKLYIHQGFNDFVICLGYRGDSIKEYFLNYYLLNSDITIDTEKNKTTIHRNEMEQFKVTLIDTGLHTMTAGRLKRVKEYLGDEPFMLTYGDGLADINLKELLSFHQSHGKIATMTVIKPEGRFGAVEMADTVTVGNFHEKPAGDNNWINGGFFVLNPEVFQYLDENADMQMWEDEPLIHLTRDRELAAYRHNGFWRCMDAMRDKVLLEDLWNNRKAKWKIW